MRNLMALSLCAVCAVAGYALPVAAADTLTAVKVAKAPKLSAADPAWAKARALTVDLGGGKNFGGTGTTKVSLKAVYDGDRIYMLAQYADPTKSVRFSPYEKQAAGTWNKLTDPDDKGGDNNRFYEDKFAVMWNIGNSIKNFDDQGCMTACHEGESGKPYGNMHTENAGETGDIWYMKSIRTGSIGQADDYYLDSTRYDREKFPDAGRKIDPKTAGGYDDIRLVDGKPEFMHKRGIAANRKGGTYFLREEDKIAFDDSKFKTGDEVASIVVSRIAGDRGDIAAAIRWTAGKWSVVLSRKLVTGSKYDVQFDKLDKRYSFGIAAFDNAQVLHAFHVGALKLKFAK